MTTTVARPGLETSLLESAYAAVADGVASGALASGVLAVATSDEVVRLEAFGPVATDSIFLIASITKPIFATSVMRLVERGHVLLNEPVAKHVPEFAANGKQDVRLWHMLTHTSGLDEAWFAQAGGPRRWDWPSVVARACAAPLQFAPGSRYSYCNPPFFVMADIIQRLTGTDHASFVRQAVLEPLGMRDTSFTPPNSSRVVPVLDPPWRDEQEQAGWIGLQNPAGGLWSTAGDLVRFGQMLLHDGELDDYRVLAPATLRAMSTLQTAGIPVINGAGEFQSSYGLGFGKAGPDSERGPSAELRSPAGFGHGGATGTYLWVEPEFDLVFVFLTNRWTQDDTTLKRALNATIAAASTS
jgi:CubicO group peptidase (beta-lactamase class C family)